MYLLTTANFEEKEYKGQKIERWQTIIWLLSLSKTLWMSIQSLRTAILHLSSTGEIIVKSTNKYSIITVVWFDKYQSYEIEPTNKQQTTNKQLTTPKEIKKERRKEIDTVWGDFFSSDEILMQTLLDFEELRKKKKPLTDRAKKILITELRKITPDEKEWIEILNNSILHNRDSVYPLKWKEQIKELTNIEIGNLRFQRSNPEAKEYIQKYNLETKYTVDQLEWFRKLYLSSLLNNNG